MSAEPLQDTLLVRLLLATDHPTEKRSTNEYPTWAPGRAPMRRVIEDHPERPLTLAASPPMPG